MTKQGVKGNVKEQWTKNIKCIYYSPHTNEENNKYKLTYNQAHKL